MSDEPSDNDVPEVEIKGVFDLTARRTNTELRQTVDELTARLAEAQAAVSNLPSLDHTFSRGKHGEKFQCKFHPSVIVDETKREVTCRYCGEVVDAFVVLCEFARKERHLYNQLVWHRKEMKDLGIEIEGLKKERKRLRAAVSDANKRLIQLRAMGSDE